MVSTRKLQGFFNRHLRIVLQFSSGKDSAACLYALEPYWDKITVLWMNPGNPYPETVEYMEKIRAMVPAFMELRGKQPEWIKEHGYPVDVLPVSSSPFIHSTANQRAIKLQPFPACCSANFWLPMMNWCVENEVTGIIRGQKLSDRMKTGVRSGDVINGMEYLFPLEDWTDEEVFSFLGDRVPPSYKNGLISSLDCKNCTAYVQENPNRIPHLQLVDPETAEEVKEVYRHLYEETMATMDLLEHYK